MNFRSLIAVTAVAVVAASCGTRSSTCDSTTCAIGCCDSAGVCQTPTDLTCGTNGAACSQCQFGTSCLLGACTGGTGGGSGTTGGGNGTTGGGNGTTGGGDGTTGGGNGTTGGGTGTTGGGDGTTGGGTGAPEVPVSFSNCPSFTPCLTVLPMNGPLTYVSACIDTTEQQRYADFFDRSCGPGSTFLANWSGTIQGTAEFDTGTVTRDVTSTLAFSAFISGTNCGGTTGCAAVQQAVTQNFGFSGTCTSNGSTCTCDLSRTLSQQATEAMTVHQTHIELPSSERVFDTCGSSGAIRYRERTPANPLQVPEIGIYTLTPYP